MGDPDQGAGSPVSGLSHDHCPRLQVDGEMVSKIGPGLLCLVGLGTGDTDADAEYMCALHKCFNLRCFQPSYHYVAEDGIVQ